MTTESAPLVPLVRGKSKKRKPSFRPASKNKRTAAATASKTASKNSAASKSVIRGDTTRATSTKAKSTTSSTLPSTKEVSTRATPTTPNIPSNESEKETTSNVTGRGRDTSTPSTAILGDKATTTVKETTATSAPKNVSASASILTKIPVVSQSQTSIISATTTASSKQQKKKRTKSTISIGSSRTIRDPSSKSKPPTSVRLSSQQQHQQQQQVPQVDDTSSSTAAQQKQQQQQQQQQLPPSSTGATTGAIATTTTSTAEATPVPAAQPGEVTLQSFCSKFRSKEKRPKTQQKQAAPPPPPVDEDESNNAQPAGPVVQVINGEIVLQESSMVVPPRKTVQEVEEEFQHVVEEEAHTSVVGASYNSFVSRRAPQHWTVEETKLFYTALRQVGTNFAIMGEFFKNRTRKQLKRKYQVEFSRHPDLIALALKPESRIPLEISRFNVTEEDVAAVKLPTGDPVIERVVEEEPKDTQPSSKQGRNQRRDNNDEGYDEQNVIVEDGDETSGPPDKTGGPEVGSMFGGLGAGTSSLVEQAESLFSVSEPMPPPQENNDDGFMEEAFEEMQSEKTAAMSTISLVPTKKKTKAKRPKFKAARGGKKRNK